VDSGGDCVIVVVTGHDEFEYAQRAVSLPVFEYILKPVEPAHLAEVLKKATERLAKRRAQNELLQWAEQEVKSKRAELLRELFDDWLQGFSTPEELEERKRVLSLDAIRDSHLLAVQTNSRYFGAAAMALGEHKVVKLAVGRLVEEALGPERGWVRFEDRFERSLYLISGPLPEDSREALRALIRRRLNAPVRIELSRCSLDYEGFIQDYERLSAAMGDRVQDEAFIEKITAFMGCNYGRKELSLELAAAAMYLSPGYVSRLLKRHTGYSFSEFTNRYRILKAIELIKGGGKMMYEIADEVGYASQHYFSRIFKRIAGSAPANFRKDRG
jgi:two-component system, response regulator YesN